MFYKVVKHSKQAEKAISLAKVASDAQGETSKSEDIIW